MKYITHIHDRPEVSTFGDFVDQGGLGIASNFIGKEEELLNYDGGTGTTNYARLRSMYLPEEAEANLNVEPKKLLMKVNTEILVPMDNIFRESLSAEGNLIHTSHSYSAFMAGQLERMLKDPSYVSKINYREGNTISAVTEVTAHISVWMWCRALVGTDGNTQRGFIDVTKFVRNLTVGSRKEGGNFSFSLVPVMCETDERGTWRIKKHTIREYTHNNGKEFTAFSTINSMQKGELRRSQFLFHNMISSNDMVFIRFETLESEPDRLKEPFKQFSGADLVGKNFDMMGFVDARPITTNPSNSEVNIEVSGRDLTKMLIEDGCYFYASEFAQGMFANADTSNRALNRVFGSIEQLGVFTERSIGYTIKFVINQLANTGMVPDDLFDAYGDRRSMHYRLGEESIKRKSLLSKKMDMAREATLDYINQSRLEGKLTDVRWKDGDGERALCVAIMEELRSLLLDIRKQKQLNTQGQELLGWEKYSYQGSKYGAMEYPTFMQGRLFRKPAEGTNETPQLASYATDEVWFMIWLSEQQNKGDEYKLQPMQGAWQLFKVLIDENVGNRMIVDSSIATESGSIMNFLTKVAQEPFVDISFDTYGDQFFMVVKQPATNAEGIRSKLSGQTVSKTDVRFESVEGQELQDAEIIIYKDGKQRSPVIDIYEEDILQETLDFDDSQVYSWYKITPQGTFFGDGTKVSLAYLPAVFFEEYAAIWGSRPLDISSNYIPYIPTVGGAQEKNTQNHYEKQAFTDLKFVVDSHCYLPFTRRGTLRLRPDRRIKHGTMVRHVGTGEVFKVDSVTNTYSISDKSIQRSTNLEVSRGMKEEYVEGVMVNGVLMSYFTIIDTPIDNNTFAGADGNVTILNNPMRDWKVNKEVFDFFIRRGQFK